MSACRWRSSLSSWPVSASTPPGASLSAIVDASAGSNSANSFSGKLAQRQNLNAFDVSGQFLPTDPTEVPLKFTGIAYLKPATASGTKATFVLIADSASAGQTAVVSGIYTAQ